MYVYVCRFSNRNFMEKSGRNKRRARTQEYFSKLLCVECKLKENSLLHYIVDTELGLQVHNIKNQKTYFLLITVIQLQISLGGTIVLVRFTKGLQKCFSLYIFSSKARKGHRLLISTTFLTLNSIIVIKRTHSGRTIKCILKKEYSKYSK